MLEMHVKKIIMYKKKIRPKKKLREWILFHLLLYSLEGIHSDAILSSYYVLPLLMKKCPCKSLLLLVSCKNFKRETGSLNK